MLRDVEGWRGDRELDPVWGRYPLGQRINKDEVPWPFGASSRTIEPVGSSATHVIRPAGWGARIATAIIGVTGNGLLLDIGLIFRSKVGDKALPTSAALRKEDKEYALVEGVFVLWQDKAWIDTVRELQVVKKMIKPYVTKVRCPSVTLSANPIPQLKEDNTRAEFFLQHDKAPGHYAFSVLRHCKETLDVLVTLPPPNTTHVIQLIDDNIGRLVRLDYLKRLDTAVDEAAEAGEKWTAPKKRGLVVKLTAAVVQLWRTDIRKLAMLKAAAVRTGLAMSIVGDNLGLKPVRFPKDYAQSVMDTTSAYYKDVVPFSPFKPVAPAPDAAPDAPVEV